MTVKEQAISAISALPEDASYDDAITKVLFLKSIDLGLKDIEEGNVVSHDEIKKKFGI